MSSSCFGLGLFKKKCVSSVSTCFTFTFDCFTWFRRFTLFFFLFFGLCTLLLIVPRYFLFSVVLGRSEVVYVVQVASSGSTLFLLVLGRFNGFQMFWRVSSCLRSKGCIVVAHVVKSDSDSSRLSKLDL